MGVFPAGIRTAAQVPLDSKAYRSWVHEYMNGGSEMIVSTRYIIIVYERRNRILDRG